MDVLDPRPQPRVRNPDLLGALHHLWRECAICGTTDRLSLHHVHKHPRSDVEANLVMLCGDGVQGCHGRVEAHHGPTVGQLMNYLLDFRSDTLVYLVELLGRNAAEDWLRRQMS
jgi:5-methylcytosine-specific restriction endonuclease McrA